MLGQSVPSNSANVGEIERRLGAIGRAVEHSARTISGWLRWLGWASLALHMSRRAEGILNHYRRCAHSG